MASVTIVKEAMNNILFRSVLSGMSGYFLYPQNDALVRLVRQHAWLRYVFLYLLIWQSPTGGSLTRTALATAIVFVIMYILVPSLDKTLTDQRFG